MKLSRPVVINTALAAVIVIAGASVLLIFNPFSAKTVAATTQLTGTVQQGTVSSSITATGSTDPLQQVNASFAASGTIATVNVALGATVAAGEVLGTLQTTDLQAAVTNAQTTLSRANSSLADANNALVSAETTTTSTSGGSGNSQSGGGSNASSISSAQQQVNSAANAVDSDETALSVAQQNLAGATLVAPIGGLVIAVNGTVGESSSSGSSGTGSSSSGASGSSSSTSSSSTSGFMTIADVSKYTVSAAIAEADIADVKVGQAAKITYPAITGASSTATVTAIAPTATSSNSIVTYATTITLTNPPANLRLGQTADVTITTESSKADALYVPAAAITTANGVSTVKVITKGKTKAVTVKTGVVGDDGTEITSGLTAGETIVIGSVSTATNSSTTTGTTGTTGRSGFGGSGTGGFGTTGGFTGGGTGGFTGGGGGGFGNRGSNG